MSDKLISCDGHGDQLGTFVCQHLAHSQPDEPSIGFHWGCDDGDLMANCDACEAHADADGFLSDDFFVENFVIICRVCFVEMAAVNGVPLLALEAAEAAFVASSQGE